MVEPVPSPDAPSCLATPSGSKDLISFMKKKMSLVHVRRLSGTPRLVFPPLFRAPALPGLFNP